MTGEQPGQPDQLPLYCRVLRLRHLRPSSWQRALLVEGVLAISVALAMSDLASAWIVLVMPAAVTAVVKLNDILAGLIVGMRPIGTEEPVAQPQPDPVVPRARRQERVLSYDEWRAAKVSPQRPSSRSRTSGSRPGSGG